MQQEGRPVVEEHKSEVAPLVSEAPISEGVLAAKLPFECQSRNIALEPARA